MLNLSDVFYELIDDGYIYDTDENGYQMSYGEYAAIADYFWNLVEDELDQYSSFEEKLNAWEEILQSADDDVYMFWTWDEDNTFYFEIDEDAGTYDVTGTLPECLRESWEEFERYTDLVPAEYARPPKFD